MSNQMQKTAQESHVWTYIRVYDIFTGHRGWAPAAPWTLFRTLTMAPMTANLADIPPQVTYKVRDTPNTRELDNSPTAAWPRRCPQAFRRAGRGSTGRPVVGRAMPKQHRSLRPQAVHMTCAARGAELGRVRARATSTLTTCTPQTQRGSVGVRRSAVSRSPSGWQRVESAQAS